MSRKRLIAALAVLAVACSLFYVLHRADQSQRRFYATPQSTAVVSPAGTWLADTGAHFQLRTDGTGRSRDPNFPSRGVHYFEWESNGSTLTLHYVPRSRIKRFVAYKLGHESASYTLIENKLDELVLAVNGGQTRFTPTTDYVLDADP